MEATSLGRGFSISGSAAYHILGATNSNGTFITQKYQNRTKPMVDRNKNVVMPERLQLGGLSTHGFWPDYTKKYKR